MTKFTFTSLAISIFGLPSLLFSITDATWLGGAWNNNADWTYNSPPNVFPNAIDTTARFTGVSGNIPLNQTITVGHIEHSAGNVTINTADTLIFSVSSGSATFNSTGTGDYNIFTNSVINLLSPLMFSNTSTGAVFASAFLGGSEDLTIGQGTLRFQPLSASTYAGNIILGSTGVLNPDSGLANFVCGGISGTGTINLTNGVTFQVNSVSSSSFSGNITSDHNFAFFSKCGTAGLTLSGEVSVSGVLINGGTISLSNLDDIDILGFGAGGDFGPVSPDATLNLTGSSPITYGNDVIVANSTGLSSGIDNEPKLTLTGAISGTTGSFSKSGVGELVLSGSSPEMFTMPITVLEGTLTAPTSIANPVTVSGGIFNLTGSTSGTTTVNSGGTFTITGTTSASTTVNSGGLLKGTGTLQNVSVNAGGTIRPGNSIGTLDVSGTLSLIGITQIEISPSSSSQIHVTGLTTLLGGTVNVIQDAGSYPSSGSYPIIVSDGGIVGLLSPTVTGGASGFLFSLDYSTPNTVTLLYQLSAFPIPASELTGQANKFAQYLNQNVPLSSATQLLSAVPANQLEAALDSASPSRNAFAPFAVQNTMISFSDLVSGHLVDQRFYHAQKRYNPNVAVLMDDAASFTADSSGRMMYSRPCETQSFWIGVMGEYAHQAALDQNPAFNFWSGGSMIGWDFYGDQNLFGLAGGAAYTHLIQDENGGNAKINYYFASVYDTFYGPCDFPLYMEFALWGVYNQIHNYRNISFPGFEGTASATFHSWELVPHLGFGYHASYCCFSLEPFAQFDLVVDWQEGFQEHGVGAFDMTHTSRNSQFLRSEGGLRLYKIKQTNWGTWMAMIKGSFVNKKAFGTGAISASIVGTSALFSVETFRNTENLGACGVEWLWRWGHRKPVTLSLAYNGEFGSQFWSQEGMIRLMKDF